ncbi:MAG: hypothetical protein NTZ55_04460 [Candidatus Roizmanbacteria bacterium]|nr:hypothetical protein [Candidatus Roizmanbacteria bacterium]
MSTDKEELYKTKDLGEAGALLVKQQKLARITREGKVCWFEFENPTVCLELCPDYFFGELLVNANEYYETLSKLKNRIFSEK